MNRKIRYLLAAIFFLPLVPACAHLPKAADAPPVIYVERDTAWSGEVRVEGIVHVRKSATLTILPGTRVIFAPNRFPPADEHEGFSSPGIRVEGRIVAEGTEDAPIVFTSAAGPARPGAWDKILFTFSAGNRFLHCTFEGARYAFHAHFSEISVRRCIFRENEEGVRLGTSRVRIEDSVFTRNEIRGINFRECRNEIRRNLVFGNGDGVFLHSKDSASVLRENAIYANRNFNARLGDLHSDDIDLSGNWWGTSREAEARATVFDGANLPGVGTAKLSPVLARPPVAGATVRGVFVVNQSPMKGAVVRAYASLSEGFFGDGYVAESFTDENGVFRLLLPPGRYFISGRADSSGGMLFAFTGKNPVLVSLGETVEIGLPAVVAPPKAVSRTETASRSSIVARTTFQGKPEGMVAVQAARPDAPDFRGAGEASALTNEGGVARLFLPPGKYLLSARKRTTGAAVGMVEEGGLFGVYPYSPVEVAPGTSVFVEIPLFRKQGLLAGEDAGIRVPEPAAHAEATALLSGKAAQGYIVFFYRPPETIGRPVARSSVVSGSGRFTVHLPGDGEYSAFLRKAIQGVPGGAEEERIGPFSVRLEGGRFLPGILSFGSPAR
ncbi:MAG: right-handed parallel beta-helix repeat-containing protein [Deltaproteobacteria bacterium]|nr:right-handed parallel beta-helix repeat-containing protein [Deltaproteobacteria bacterium]